MGKDYKELSAEDTDKLHKIQLEMLIEFIKICNHLDLRYYVIGGTALGAIRHEGFIPWDDDIDVGMPRRDYEIFTEKANSLLSENYFVQTFKSDPFYVNNFAKIRNENTTFIENTVRHLRISHGVYIDIFPLDGVKNLRFTKLKKRIYSTKLDENFDTSSLTIKPSFKRMVFKNIVGILLARYTIKDILNYRENLYKKYDYDKCKTVANFSGAWGDKEIVPKSYFGEGEIKHFEGTDVIVPQNYDGYLKKLYGNYMELPPVEKRVTHHYCTVIDLTKSYKSYIDQKQ